MFEGRPRTATVTARTDARLIVDRGPRDLRPAARQPRPPRLAILRTMATRLGNTEAVLRQHDTLAGLGRIAAGLAHELNNPASAVKRGAVDFSTTSCADVRGRRVRAARCLARRGADSRDHTVHLPRPRPITPAKESAMQRARREQALEAALEHRRQFDRRVAARAGTRRALRWDVAVLDGTTLATGRRRCSAVLRWVITRSRSTRA